MRRARHDQGEPALLFIFVFSSGLANHMKQTKRISLWAAGLRIGGYPKLLFDLARQLGLEIHVIGRARYVKEEDLDRLALHSEAWLNRPRKRRPSGRERRPKVCAADSHTKPTE
jgi:hypothetical protein